MFGLDTTLSILLVVCILLACFFEFINGFHDTANAVATVIYTNSLKPTVAVVYSGLLNFAGVMLGGIAVAMGIVNLLPTHVLVDADPYHGISMVLAMLISAIVWNFGTWYFGIPSSSSHTLIGSILGIGLAFYFLPGDHGFSAVNWDKAKDTGMALLLSPLLGFSVAIIVMFIFKRIIKNEIIYKEPIPGKKPPIWIRMILWTTCGMVSFFHGQNDGQKGVGLVMLILISVLPHHFSVDAEVNLQSINAHVNKMEVILNRADTNVLALKEKVLHREILHHAEHFQQTVGNEFYAGTISLDDRFQLRKDILTHLERFAKTDPGRKPYDQSQRHYHAGAREQIDTYAGGICALLGDRDDLALPWPWHHGWLETHCKNGGREDRQTAHELMFRFQTEVAF